MRGTTSAAAATIRAVGAGQRQGSCDHAGGLRSRVRGPHTGHRPGTLAGSRRHSRALELGRPVRTSLLVGRFQHHRPSKLVIKLRAPRVHQRTANDGHRRAPAVNLRSRPLTITNGFCTGQRASARVAMWCSGAGRTADLPLFRRSRHPGQATLLQRRQMSAGAHGRHRLPSLLSLLLSASPRRLHAG